MSQRIGIGLGLVVFLTLNAVVLMRALRRDAPEAADLEKTRAEEMRKIRAGRRAIPVFISKRQTQGGVALPLPLGFVVKRLRRKTKRDSAGERTTLETFFVRRSRDTFMLNMKASFTFAMST